MAFNHWSREIIDNYTRNTCFSEVFYITLNHRNREIIDNYGTDKSMLELYMHIYVCIYVSTISSIFLIRDELKYIGIG